MDNVWKSPDGRIEKSIITFGKFGTKPLENSECTIKINATNLDVVKYNESPIIIGDVYSYFDKLLHICIQSMCQGEIAQVMLKIENDKIEEINLELRKFTSDGFIYEWDASKKYNLALDHKMKGVELCKNDSYTVASYRFGKALKILCSIPLDVEEPPLELDGISIRDIDKLKANLYSNLGKCFLNNGKNNETVIRLCKKSLDIDNSNVKTLYRCGLAYLEEHDYESAIVMFKSILSIEADNKPALNMLKIGDKKLAEANARVNVIIKKMFN